MDEGLAGAEERARDCALESAMAPAVGGGSWAHRSDAAYFVQTIFTRDTPYASGPSEDV